MKVVKTGNAFRIYGDDLVVYDRLPAGTYKVGFSKMIGFYLETHSEMEIKEERIYGDRQKSVDKVLRKFVRTNRNLGVILSGAKGIGKSLFAKMLSRDAVAKDYPVIIVSEYIPGVASFLEEIKQEVAVLFDEFDKVFEDRGNDQDVDPQTTLLTLFDGVSSGKKLFIITCNEIKKLNQFYVNRPGRFHYHFRFEFPNLDEVREYLDDNLEGNARNEISGVLEFAKKVPLNYDCLRAIVEELAEGESFKDAIQDLNILNVDAQRYRLVLVYEDGTNLSVDNIHMDLFDSDGEESFWFYDKDGEQPVRVDFRFNKIQSSINVMYDTIDGDDLKLTYALEDDSDFEQGYIQRLKQAKVLYLEIHRKKEKSLHYLTV